MDPPLPDDHPSFADGVVDLAIKKFVPEAGVEALDVAVLLG
jgi:hypothetical protein